MYYICDIVGCVALDGVNLIQSFFIEHNTWRITFFWLEHMYTAPQKTAGIQLPNKILLWHPWSVSCAGISLNTVLTSLCRKHLCTNLIANKGGVKGEMDRRHCSFGTAKCI